MPNENWTNKEVEYLRSNYDSQTAAEIAETLERTKHAIYSRAKKEGITGSQKGTWTKEEIEFLIRVGSTWTDPDVASYLDRTVSAIRTKKHGLDRSFNKRRWSRSDENFLKENYEEMTDSELAEELNRTETAVLNKRENIGLYRRKESDRWSQNTWSGKEEQFLKDNPDIAISELATELDRSEQAIRDKRNKLDIKKRTGWTEEETQFLRDHYHELSAAEIAEELDRSKNSVYGKARMEKLTESDAKSWTDHEEEFLKRIGPIWDDEAVAAYLDRSLPSIRSKKSKLDYVFGKGRRWTDEDEEYVENHFPQMTDRGLAEELERTIRGIKNRRRRELGLIRKGFLEDTIWQAWERVCIEVGHALYDDVVEKPELPNGTYPEMRRGDTLIEVKKSPFTHRVDADVEHYRPHCDRLEVWSLFGVRRFEADDVTTVGVEGLQDRVREADIGGEKAQELVRKLELCANGVDPYRSGQQTVEEAAAVM